jgi:hypothetical protein
MQKDSGEARRIDAEWLQTPRSVKISNTIALGVGMALLHGGGIESLGMMIPSIVAAYFLARPTVALVLAGLVMFGNVSTAYMDAGQPNIIPALTAAALYALVGYASYLGSKRLIRWLQKCEKHRLIKFLPVLYITAYFTLTLLLAAMLSPGGAS